MSAVLNKKLRQQKLQELIIENPFMSDDELSEALAVSIQTVRLYRLQLGIPELRERIRKAAESNISKVVGVGHSDIIGEIIELDVNQRGMSILEATREMVFKETNIVKGHYIFAMAESLAMALIEQKAAITGVANIKYQKPTHSGEKLIARGEVVKKRDTDYIVHVKITVKGESVFRGKFILVPILESSILES